MSKQREVKQWITINGRHVPVYEDGSLGGAYEKFDKGSKEKESHGGSFEAELEEHSDPEYKNVTKGVKTEKQSKAAHINPVSKQLMKDDISIGEGIDPVPSKYNGDEQADAISYMYGISLPEARQAIVDGKYSDDDIKRSILYQETEGIPSKQRHEAYERSLKKYGLQKNVEPADVVATKAIISKEAVQGVARLKEKYANKSTASNKVDIDSLKSYGYDPHDATGDPTVINADGKSYYKIGDDKWNEHSAQGKALGGTYSDKQMAEKLQGAKDVKVLPSAKSIKISDKEVGVSIKGGPMSKEEAYMNYKAIRISKHMSKERQEELRKLKNKYYQIWKG